MSHRRDDEQANISGDPVERDQTVHLADVDGPVAVDGGEAVDARHAQGMVYKPSGDVHQHFGDKITIIQSSAQEPTTDVQVDLQACEQRYRERIKERFAEDAAYFIPLAGETTESVPIQGEARAPRSARRRGQRAAVEYREWIETERKIKKVKLDSLREGVDKYPCIILLGDPGSGKTTVLENLAYQFADEPDRLPVLLQLSEFGPGMSLHEFVDQGWGGSLEAGHWGAPNLAANLEGYLEEGKLQSEEAASGLKARRQREALFREIDELLQDKWWDAKEP